MEPETQEKLQALEKMIEAMEDNEHRMKYKKQKEQDAETIRRSTTDNRSLALQIES